ncbi:MAG TPA: hypothetical protein PKC18_01600 [Lacipirellulaceae bacterium]|nr:hypothetical protein [Lacipirellulaceae bacterium]
MRKQTTQFSTLILSAAAAVALSAYVLPTPVVFAADDGHKHKEGEKHEHKEGEKHGDEHAGPNVDLGTMKIGGFDVQVTRVGELKAGEEAVFIIKPTGGTGEPKAVRAWVGVETGQGSIKTKAEEEKEGEWHAHHNVSKPMPANSKLWIEVEAGSTKSKGSYDLKM